MVGNIWLDSRQTRISHHAHSNSGEHHSRLSATVKIRISIITLKSNHGCDGAGVGQTLLVPATLPAGTAPLQPGVRRTRSYSNHGAGFELSSGALWPQGSNLITWPDFLSISWTRMRVGIAVQQNISNLHRFWLPSSRERTLNRFERWKTSQGKEKRLRFSTITFSLCSAGRAFFLFQDLIAFTGPEKGKTVLGVPFSWEMMAIPQHSNRANTLTPAL